MVGEYWCLLFNYGFGIAICCAILLEFDFDVGLILISGCLCLGVVGGVCCFLDLRFDLFWFC